ncbi:hypothetical protein ACFP9Y_14110 [Nonomuraea cavernae]
MERETRNRSTKATWVEQTRPGGVIVTPWSPGWAFGVLGSFPAG